MNRLLTIAAPGALALTGFLPSAPSSSGAPGARGAPAATGTELVFGPADGLVLVKSSTYTTDFVLDDFAVELNGEEMEIPDMGDVTNGSEGRLVVRDTYGGVSAGRVTRSTRSFREATQRTHSAGPDGETDDVNESPLVGLTVVFTWDDEDEEYAVAFAPDDSGADEDLLVDLEPGIDFEALLPDGAVDEGDSWAVDAVEMADVLSAGGDLKFDDEPDPQIELIDEAVAENLEGEINCTFAGLRAVGGREVAVITLTVEAAGEAEADGTEDVGESGFEVEVSRAATVKLELAGELLWDVKAKHFVSLTLAGAMTVILDETGTADFDGNGFEQHSVMTFTGERTLEFKAVAE